MSNLIFPTDFDEKTTIAQDDYILFSDSEDSDRIKKAKYSHLKWETWTAATIAVWSTSTWAAWSSASVTNSWTSSAAVFDFTIPKWDKWDTGNTWPTWPSIVSGAFVSNDLVFTKDDWNTVTISDAKTDLKWDTWDTWPTGASIVSWAFSWDDLVFTKDDTTTVTISNAKTDLKWDTWNWISNTTSSKVWKTTTVTLNYTNWWSDSFTVQDWADGTWTWDMLASTYDPNNVAADAFDTNNMNNRFFYWESTTEAATVQKEVSIPSITELNVWQVIIVKPTVTSTVASSTLKLNNFDAYKMLYNAAEITTSTDSIAWAANIPSMFYLDEVSGTKYWRFLGHWLDSNTTYTINYLHDAWRYKAWTWTYAITRYSLCMMKADGTWEKVTATNANYTTATTKTVNTNWFVLNQIKYYNTTTTVANWAFVGTNAFSSQAASVRVDYSFNCGTAPWWSVWDPIYIVWTIWVDGLFYLDTTARWSTTLPSTNDWKLYIRIWTALTTTDATISFLLDRPIFYYDSWIKEYTSSKQDKISDLATIRSGAWLWATAVQPWDLWTAASKNTWTSSWNVPVLDANGKLNKSTLPWVALTDTFTVSTSSDLTWLSSAEQWDLAIVTSESKTYVLATEPYSTAANWKEIISPTWWVTSVNSQTWAVTLDADDISDSTTTNKFVTTQTAYTSKWTSTKVATITTNTLWQVTAVSETSIAFPVTSVNGSTWAVTVDEFSPTSAWSIWQVLTKTAWWYDWSNAAWSDYSWVTKTISWWELEIWLRTILDTPASNFTLTAPSTIKEWEEYVIRIISTTSYTMALGTWFTNPRNVSTTLSANATDQYVFLAIWGELELQPLVATGS